MQNEFDFRQHLAYIKYMAYPAVGFDFAISMLYDSQVVPLLYVGKRIKIHPLISFG